MRTAVQVALVTLGLVLSPAATGQSGPQDKLTVAVSILPQAYFVERVGGQHVDVQVLVGPGQSPHAYELSPRQLEGLSRARAYFRIGIDFENALVPRIERMFRGLKVVDTRTGVPLRRMTADEFAADHDHAGCAHHDHGKEGQPDPHIWLDPRLVKIQAQTIGDTLIELDPARAEEYRSNLATFHAELDQVHERLAAALAPLKGRELLVFHPAFGYFTDAYGLKQVPVEVEGKEPTAKQLAALIQRARAADARVIFVQPQFPAKSAEAIADAIGGAVVPMDDLARDYLKNLEDIAAKVQAALAKAAE